MACSLMGHHVEDHYQCKSSLHHLAALRRALTLLFGNGAGALSIGKNSVVLTKIGKIYKVLCIEEFIVRLI